MLPIGAPVANMSDSPTAGSAPDSKTLRDWIPDIYSAAYERAHRMLRKWWGSNRPDTASLLDQAVYKLLECGASRCASREHALNMLARTMRWVLIDQAKVARSAASVPLDSILEPSGTPQDPLLALDEALDLLDKVSPRLRKVIEMHGLLGMTIEQTAAELHISTTTVSNDMRLARAFLHAALSGRRLPGLTRAER